MKKTMTNEEWYKNEKEEKDRLINHVAIEMVGRFDSDSYDPFTAVLIADHITTSSRNADTLQKMINDYIHVYSEGSTCGWIYQEHLNMPNVPNEIVLKIAAILAEANEKAWQIIKER